MSESKEYRCTACGARNRVPAARTGDAPKCGRCKSPLFPTAPLAVTADDFALRVEGSSVPVLVDFWAPWCGPCRSMERPLETLARERVGTLTVAKVNVDENPALASRFGVRSIPALKLFRDAAVIGELTGAVAPAALARFVDEHVGS